MGDIQTVRPLVDALVVVLEDQIRVYRHLLETVRKEKDILISANLDDLNENNRSKEAMLIKIRALEAQRLAAAGAPETQWKRDSQIPLDHLA